MGGFDVHEIMERISDTNRRTVELLQVIARCNLMLVEHALVETVEPPPVMQRLLPAPAPPQRSRPPKAIATPTPATPATPTPTPTPPYPYQFRSGSKAALIIDFARAHGGEFDCHLFRDDFRRRGLKPESFAKTTMYSVCRDLTRRKVMQRLDATRYRLDENQPAKPVVKAAKPAKPATPQPRTAKRLVVPPDTQRELIAFAASHEGVIRAGEYRAAYRKAKRKPPSYPDTTVFTDLALMVKDGVMRKVQPGEYELVAAAAGVAG